MGQIAQQDDSRRVRMRCDRRFQNRLQPGWGIKPDNLLSRGGDVQIREDQEFFQLALPGRGAKDRASRRFIPGR